MPEGDTLFRLGMTLRPVLAGRTLVSATSLAPIAPEGLPGLAVRDVEVRGKHLLFPLSDDSTLHVHLGMTGRFFVDALDTPGLRPAPAAVLVLETSTHRVVGHALPVLERLTPGKLLRHPRLSTLGPDLLAERFDALAVAQRYQREPFLTLGEALLDQRLACGIGNVYKSETLFLAGLDPWQRIVDTPLEALTSVLERTRALMRDNLERALRRTRPGPAPERLWVYGRSGEPCLQCGKAVEMARQGDLGRSTYFCARCQGR